MKFKKSLNYAKNQIIYLNSNQIKSLKLFKNIIKYLFSYFVSKQISSTESVFNSLLSFVLYLT